MSLLELLESLEVSLPGIAVAMDHRIVPKTDYAAITLEEGTTIEIVRAVGGG